MRELLGAPGTWGGLWLRAAQVAFAAASIGVMASAAGFAGYTAFCYLIASMGLQALWSLGLACLDGYALKVKMDLNNAVLVSLFVVGDWGVYLRSSETEHVTKLNQINFPCLFCFAAMLQVTAILSFAASCSAAGVVVLFERDITFCRRYYQLPCSRFQLATAFAFLSWSLSATSALIMFWLLASF